MTTTLSILSAKGDTRLTWDDCDQAELAKIRETVADLKAAGYSFFLTDGSIADEVSADGGTLIVRKLTTDQVANPEPEQAEPQPTKAKGRIRKVVAVRPLAGG